MNNLVKVALITGAIAIGAILLFIAFDTACLSSGAIECRVLRRFQWESIVAGALGLAGGIFVIYSTRQTLRQAKLHRADDLNAPLQLARDAADDFWAWANTTLGNLEGLLEQVSSGQQELDILESALSKAYHSAVNRSPHIHSICEEHKTTVLSFETYSRLYNLAKITEYTYPHIDGPPYGSDYHNYRVTYAFVQEARARSASARTALDRQIKANLVRCGADG